ncbi:acyl-CoA dehydrogenase family protein [Sphingomonas sp. CGMCC 1.13654]|uniref:Acyl-CoA dehydrogenase family protein n=1 Tax=Sphingomonas chungangi TaxID=2683589 RepID=A0A838L5S0_9SPHN|nr:acyl-CoA dehydrogenase family protein [Sphingomonas chungangi]MBA2933809.1 acyl-CoA dehydrogenase family protein [Sphingomonas chungangi]MVW55139.1 pimeloyl-CoA dehydrogenase small subunit [Sphingomonas chungangi]
MDFSFTDEQRQLRDGVRAFLARRYPFEQRRIASRSKAGWRPEIWQALAEELGVLALPLPVAKGGLDGDPVTTMILMEEFGEALLIEPFLETVVIGGGLLRAAGGAMAEAELREIAAGRSRLAFAWAEPASRFAFSPVSTVATLDGKGWRLDGVKSVVTAAPWATGLLITARTGENVSLFLVDPQAAGVTLFPYPTIDGRRAADIRLEGVILSRAALIGPEGGALPLIEAAGDAGIAAAGAEAVGVMRRLLADTITYTKQRRQFGQAIADFQVLQHRMVDMFMQIEMASSAVLLATLKLGADPAERARAASTAKVTVSRASRFVGQNAVQLHGGMGMTDELAIGHYFKRATAIETEFGTADHHLDRFARLGRAAA